MLQELFEKCLGEVDGNKFRATIRFLVQAKKLDPNVSLVDCMEVAGFTDKDEKKSANLAQSFRTNVFNPLRDHLVKVKFGIADTAPVFGRTNKGEGRSEENKKIREQILAMLPSSPKTRTTNAPAEKDMSFIDDLIEAE